VLIYDEPASGLDPLTTNEVLKFVGELADEGKTVLFSAHDLYHVEDICDRVIVMIDGEIVARGTVGEIRATHGTTEYHVYTTVPVEEGRTEPPRSFGNQLDGEDDTDPETEADTGVDDGTPNPAPPMRDGAATTTVAEEGPGDSERYETTVSEYGGGRRTPRAGERGRWGGRRHQNCRTEFRGDLSRYRQALGGSRFVRALLGSLVSPRRFWGRSGAPGASIAGRRPSDSSFSRSQEVGSRRDSPRVRAPWRSIMTSTASAWAPTVPTTR
jgi:hypothetical protein